MGLASKLAAAQGGATNYSSQQPAGGNSGPPEQRTGAGSYPGQPQYQAYPGANQPMPLASKLAPANSGAPSYASSNMQPGYPPSNPGYSSPMPSGYNSSPQPNFAQQQYSRAAPPPPGPPQYGGYGAQPAYQQYQPSYGQSQQQYAGQTYQQGPPGGYNHSYGGPPPQQFGGQQGGPSPGQAQYGGPPQGQPQYGGPPQQGRPGGMDVAGYQRLLENAIREKNLQAFYGPGSPGQQKLPWIAQRAAQQVARLASAWQIPHEIANDIVRLALYDVVIYIDDSGSMEFEENGSRIDDLKLILNRVAFAATLFDDDGIEIRTMNKDLESFTRGLTDQNGQPISVSRIVSEQQVQALLSKMTYKGLTPFGQELRKKVVDPILIPKLHSNMQKPLLIIGITDGQPTGEPRNTLIDTVKLASEQAARSRYGRGAVAFQFAQVGNDSKATEFLAEIDNDRSVGEYVDCTSNYENEYEEMRRTNPGVELTPQLWILKLLLGPIDPSYDSKDESGSRPPAQQAPGYGGQPGYGQGPPGGQPHYGQGPPAGQPHYGQGPPGGQPHYNQGPPGGYGQAPGYGPPGTQQQYNRPPPGPPQGQYPGQGYGGPQPPRY